MLSIKSFFEKIQNVRTKELFVRSTISDVIKKLTSIEISPENISFSSSTLHLKGINQSARSVIFIKKTNLIKEINDAQSAKVVTDIR